MIWMSREKIRHMLRTGQYDLMLDPWRRNFSPLLGVVAGSRRRTSATVEYWGSTSLAGVSGYDYWGGYTLYNVDGVAPKTCPGSGSRTLVSLELNCKSRGGTPGSIRLAIYDTSLALIAEGTSAVSVPSTTADWKGHVDASELKPAGGSAGDPITLTGGTNYLLAWSGGSTDTTAGYNLLANSIKYVAANYSVSGYPSTIGAGTSFNQTPSIRVGVL